MKTTIGNRKFTFIYLSQPLLCSLLFFVFSVRDCKAREGSKIIRTCSFSAFVVSRRDLLIYIAHVPHYIHVELSFSFYLYVISLVTKFQVVEALPTPHPSPLIHHRFPAS